MNTSQDEILEENETPLPSPGQLGQEYASQIMQQFERGNIRGAARFADKGETEGACGEAFNQAAYLAFRKDAQFDRANRYFDRAIKEHWDLSRY